jgi:ATP-dependent DNA helicase DinG
MVGTSMLTPQELDLPAKFKKWTGHQEDTIEKIVLSDKELYLLDAPTGSGKSVIGIAAATIWRTNWLTTKTLLGEPLRHPPIAVAELEEKSPPKRVIYVTRTKQLQDQLLADFPNSRTIKGRANFPCLLAPRKFPEFTAEDCPHTGKDTKCPYKAGCPYLVAKMEALNAEIAVLNESYYLAEANGPGQFSQADFVILDEIDSIESTLMNAISINITQATLQEFNIDAPREWEDWKKWVEWWNTTMGTRIGLVSKLDNSDQTDLFDQFDTLTDTQIKAGRRFRRLNNFNEHLDTFMKEILTQLTKDSPTHPLSVEQALDIIISGKETPFVVQDHRDKSGFITRWELKPVMVRGFAHQRLWRHAERFLGMSGTILSPVVVARELGLRDENYEYRQIPSTFPVKNRPIYYWPVANMRKQNIDDGTALPKMLEALNQILAKYPNQKGLVHTVSYPVASAIRHDQVDIRGSQRIIWHDPMDRVDRLEEFKISRQPLVMVSPSFDRGVDLPDDLCRFIIICKVPYLNLGDKQVAARIKAPGGDQWYVFKALQTLMQMTGRGVRSDTDFCDCYILDAQFNGLLVRTRQYIPKWWMDAIRRIETL